MQMKNDIIKKNNEERIMTMKQQKKEDLFANILKNIAKNSLKLAANSRCMYCLHQPKQPLDLRKKIE